MKEAAYYTPLDHGRVLCELCPHHCRIPEGKHGFCLTRENTGGKLIAANYCRPVSVAVDPIEKKPLFHFHPGSSIFSTGPNGCTFKCGFCQNCEISQTKLSVKEIDVKQLLHMIVESGAIGIAYTYSEPTIWYETIMDLGVLVKERGLTNVMVTNGFIEPKPLRDLFTVVDAMNIDIKSMNPVFYRRLCKGALSPVLEACEAVKKAGCHLEITNLLIPGENDGPAETAELADFMATHLGKDTPLHISRYFPRYRMERQSTPQPTLERAWEIARKRLDYVYIGNIASRDKENTHCPSCGTLLVSRDAYRIRVSGDLIESKPGEFSGPVCAKCNHRISMAL